ncbi:MAG: ABC-F family ATP-binding cassette domain-containing protein [Saprospiraceae bacterium]|jgi:ATP-binding cassette subfamily F protein 3|nr:ABC-F family ATP-binding cassette domain-containing protein [Saprospiraceae bacterium]MBK7797401.1 ABC-F family ATP-binding cassette domain-containing protein [Saprospiraceae bacterium]MBL0261484.1 ABC-F family ATP-binding cassette domain-containing protein [Saprospiraceae bacterium]
MIRLSNVSLFFGERALLKDVNLTFSPGEKVAITGRNGTGKSTMFKLITGEYKADVGSVEIPNDYTVGILKQELPEDRGLSVRDELMRSLTEIQLLKDELTSIEHKLHNPELDADEMSRLLDRQEWIHHRFDILHVDKLDGEIEKILFGLGFQNHQLDLQASTFSGGWRMRIELAKLLLSKPKALLLDEPNNHLDILSIIWLEKYLADYPGTVLLISHDLQFLDKLAKRVIEIDRARIYDYKGNYSQYKLYRAERKEIELNEYKSQQRVIQHKEALIDKFRAKANKASFAKSLQKELDRTEMMDAPEEELSSIRLRFQPSRQSGRVVLEAHHLSKSYGEKNVFENIEMLIERGQKLSFVGGNGNGKSTMVKLICDEIKPSEGEIKVGYEVKIGYYAQEHTEILNVNKNVLETIEDAAIPTIRPFIRKLLGGLGFEGQDVDKKIKVLSGGEKARVRLAMLLVNEHNLLILDEPTHHLDIPSKDSLKEAIIHYGGTVIIVSHDREFLRGIASRTISFEDHTIKSYEGDIDYFIEKSGVENTQGGLNTPKSVQKGSMETLKSPDEGRKLQKQIQTVEKSIEKLEESIKSIEVKMANADFFTNTSSDKIIAEYDSIKKDLKQKTSEWEELMTALEIIS